MIFSTIEWSILIPALVAGMLVLSTHVPLGIEVLRRGIIFIDLAIAQIAALGAIVAVTLWPEHAVAVQLLSLGAALGGALLLTWTEKHFADIQEALIGCLFVLAASLALLLLSQNPHGAEHMKDLLAGQILWVSNAQLVTIALVYAALLLVWFCYKERLGRAGFYVVFAVAVTASVQLVGVYLVFASLIIPALASRAWQGSTRLVAGYFVGTAGLVLGLIVSALQDVATGPAIVVSLAVVGLGVMMVRRR